MTRKFFSPVKWAGKLGVVLLGAWGVLGCLQPRDSTKEEGFDPARCARCHGDPERGGDSLRRAAPPRDLSGAWDTAYPGVGAHTIHLDAGDTHGPVACSECHRVPSTTDEGEHADTDLPAEVIFGTLATQEDGNPTYDRNARRCSDTYCHGAEEPHWTRPRSSEEACGSCHGLPPPAPHPSSERCQVCHGQVIDETGTFVRPQLHVDGRVQVEFPKCSSCHGDDQSPAPPRDTASHESPLFIGVGAHRAHLFPRENFRPVPCETCHEVPKMDSSFYEHIDGREAEVRFNDAALARDRNPEWDRSETSCFDTWCHSPSEARWAPLWTETEDLDCQGCHGMPPPAPHPQMVDCSICHGATSGRNGTIISPDLHVNGAVDVQVPTKCTTCHGGENAAPPTDLEGHTDTQESGVGAHQTHVRGTERSRAVPCSECHPSVESVLAEGHVDTALPVELEFSGVATATGVSPVFQEGSCQKSYCHGAAFPEGRNSGGSLLQPSWTQVDGSQNACGSCHGLPPPLGHPQVSDCASCHLNTKADNQSFFQPELHVNGVVETYLVE